MINEAKSFEEAIVDEELSETLAQLQRIVSLNNTSAVYDPISNLIGQYSSLFKVTLQRNSSYPELPEIRVLSDLQYSSDGVSGVISGVESYSHMRDKLVHELEAKHRLALSVEKKVYWEKVLTRESESFRLLKILCRYANDGSILAQNHYENSVYQIRGTANAGVDYDPMLNQQLSELLKARNSVFLSPSSHSLESYCSVALDYYASPEFRKAFFAVEGVKQSEWDAYVSKGVAILNKLEVVLMMKDFTV